LSAVNGRFLSTTFSSRRLPILRITFEVDRPDGSAYQNDLDFWVDSGFDGSLKIPESFSSTFNAMGLEGIELNDIGVASGSGSGFVYLGRIVRIRLGTNMIPLSSPIDCDITCLGPDDRSPLIGLAALQQWVVCLDLPRQLLSIQ